MVCPNCNTENRDLARKCKNCNLVFDTLFTVVPVQPVVPVPPERPDTGAEGADSQPLPVVSPVVPPPLTRNTSPPLTSLNPPPEITPLESRENPVLTPLSGTQHTAAGSQSTTGQRADTQPVVPLGSAQGTTIPVITGASSLQGSTNTQASTSASVPGGTSSGGNSSSASTSRPSPPDPRPRPVAGYAISAVLAALLGAGGGYSAAKRGDPAVQGEVQQLRTELARTKDQSAQSEARARQIASDLAAEKQREQETQQQTDAGRGDLQKNLDQLQKNLVKVTADRDRSAKQLVALQASLTGAQARLQELQDSIPQRIKQVEAASAQRVQQLTNQLRDKDNEVASLRKKPSSSSGVLIWTGDLKGKKVLVDILNGVPSMGNLSSGSLPGKPCTVVAADPSRVKMKGKPAADNNWNRLSFEVSGNGPTDVRLYWTLQ